MVMDLPETGRLTEKGGRVILSLSLSLSSLCLCLYYLYISVPANESVCIISDFTWLIPVTLTMSVPNFLLC